MKETLISILLLISSSALADLKLVQTSFWQTVYEDNFNFKLINDSKELRKECDFFSSTIWNEQGEEGWLDQQTFEFINSSSLPGDMLNRSFYIEFKLNIPSNLTIIEDLGLSPQVQAIVSNEQKKDLLPHFTQLPVEMKIHDSSFFSTPSVTLRENKSFSRIAQKLNLKLQKVKLVRRGSENLVIVLDKAIACDLLNNSVNLNLTAKGEVKILFANQVRLTNIYSSYQTLIEKAFNISQNTHIRAALIGAFLGNDSSLRENMNNDHGISKLTKLLNQLFDMEKMTPSQHWTNGISGKNLSVTGTSPLVDIYLQIDGPERGD